MFQFLFLFLLKSSPSIILFFFVVVVVVVSKQAERCDWILCTVTTVEGGYAVLLSISCCKWWRKTFCDRMQRSCGWCRVWWLWCHNSQLLCGHRLYDFSIYSCPPYICMFAVLMYCWGFFAQPHQLASIVPWGVRSKPPQSNGKRLVVPPQEPHPCCRPFLPWHTPTVQILCSTNWDHPWHPHHITN